MKDAVLAFCTECHLRLSCEGQSDENDAPSERNPDADTDERLADPALSMGDLYNEAFRNDDTDSDQGLYLKVFV